MKILWSIEFCEQYRGMKDFDPGVYLLQNKDIEFHMIIPIITSPWDKQIFNKKYFPSIDLPKLPRNFFIHTYRALPLKYKFYGATIPINYIKLVKTINPDVIVSMPYTTITPRDYLNYYISKIYNIPWIVINIGDIPSGSIPPKIKNKIEKIEKIIYKQVKLIITFNKLTKDHYINAYKIPSSIIHVIPKPINIDKFSNLKHKNNNYKYFKKENLLHISYIGRLTYPKGPQLILKCLAKYPKLQSLVEVSFFGKGSNDSCEIDMKKYALNKKIKNVNFHGYIINSEIPSALEETDLAINIPFLTGFSTVYAEIMAAGIPLIITGIGYEDALPFKHLENVYYISRGNIKQLYDGIMYFLNSENRKKIGKRAKLFAINEMNASEVIKKWYYLFNKTLNN